MKKKIIIGIGIISFLTIIFFNVQSTFSVDKNSEKVGLQFTQSEALAIGHYAMIYYQNGCRCEFSLGSSCDVGAQCLCSWGNCECCENQPE